MWTVTSLSAGWPDAHARLANRRAPFVAVVAGIDGSGIVDAALADTALSEAPLVRFEPRCAAPCDALLWRLETVSGESLNTPGLLRRYWHRAPYAMTFRLAQYQPGSTVPEVLDEGTLGTRGPYSAFKAAIDRMAMRFVRDAALGRGRGPANATPADPPHGSPGWLNFMRTKWRDRLMVEWWSLGTSNAPVEQVVSRGELGDVTWYRPKAGNRYLADPFPWPGSGRILCEEMPLSHGVGRIVSVTEVDRTLSPPAVVLDDGEHHSYPATLGDSGVVYCVPEATQRGATVIHRLDDDGRLTPTCAVAPHARLADPTLFRWNGRYWLACTDLDVGGHDNLCLLHAPAVTGPWTPHTKWPVKIDVRSARPAGMLFQVDGRLFRPGQDCAATYGGAVAINEIQILDESDFREELVTVLRPDQTGPFPHGLHTLVHDGERFWLDGKRFVFDLGTIRRKFTSRAFRRFTGMRVD